MMREVEKKVNISLYTLKIIKKDAQKAKLLIKHNQFFSKNIDR